MVIWFDSEENLRDLGWTGCQAAGSHPVWPSALDPLWHASGSQASPTGWMDSGIGPGWDHLLVVGESRESQYDLLRGLDPAELAGLGKVACLALSGQGFHGQHGRSWDTLRGNLHLSLAVPLDLEATRFSPTLVMLPAVAVVDALTGLLPRSGKSPEGLTGIKWVNDILWEGGKLAGVLTASRSQQGKITGAVFGVGLNVAAAPAIPADSLQKQGICLARIYQQEAPDLGSVVAAVLTAMGQRLDQVAGGDAASIFQAYRNHSVVIGQDMVLMAVKPDPDGAPPEVLHRGRVTAIGPDLALYFHNLESPLTSGRLHFAS